MAARVKIIVLKKEVGEPVYSYAFWADVPVSRQAFYANPSATSQWNGALAGDLASLRDGSVVERVSSLRLGGGTTLAQAQAELESRWAEFQAEIVNANPWVRYGSTWDGTTWALGGVS